MDFTDEEWAQSLAESRRFFDFFDASQVDLDSIISFVEERPQDQGGWHRVAMQNFLRRGLDEMAIQYANHYGLSVPPLIEMYVGPLDAFTCYALAKARKGDFSPSRDLFERLRPVRAIEEISELVQLLPLEELDNDALTYVYGLWCMQEVIGGRTYPERDAILRKCQELSGFRDEKE